MFSTPSGNTPIRSASRRARTSASRTSDNQWLSRLVVAAAIVEAVELLDLEYPKVTQDQRKELAAARAELIAEK
jgi:hypothetical protein